MAATIEMVTGCFQSKRMLLLVVYFAIFLDYLLVTAIVFAFGDSYGVLFFARSFQGLGTACTITAGMGMLATAYTDDAERGAAMGVALGGLGLGILVGPTFGGFLSELFGWHVPFTILAFMALLNGILQLFTLRPHVENEKKEKKESFTKELMTDPYIIISAGSIFIANLAVAALQPSLPLWMLDKMGTGPAATAMTDASMFPQMGYLVDTRHKTVIYGAVYAIAFAVLSLAYSFGPTTSGPIVSTFGFPVLMYTVAAINFLYAPLMLFLRNPPVKTAEAQANQNENIAASTKSHYTPEQPKIKAENNEKKNTY